MAERRKFFNHVVGSSQASDGLEKAMREARERALAPKQVFVEIKFAPVGVEWLRKVRIYLDGSVALEDEVPEGWERTDFRIRPPEPDAPPAG